MHCSVIIPTKNGGALFRDVLAEVLHQDTDWPFEVIVIDSGSTDGTVEFARDHEHVRVIAIAPSEFGHGRTRNQAISASAAPFIAMITHDAKPASRHWLKALVHAVERDDTIAGAFGRHVAHPGASPFTQRDLDTHFEGFAKLPLVVSKTTSVERYAHDIGWRQFLHFFSDNNSCLRRSVWERVPYPDVNFAEDQLWAAAIIEKGYSKAYAPDAIVHHSHDYALFERLQRAFDESRSFKVSFGYDLSPSFRRAIRSGLGHNIVDLIYAYRTGMILRRPLHVLNRMLEDWSLVIGHRLGTISHRIPLRMQTLLSRDQTLYRCL